ncbi:AAA family ATPase [Ancylobacter defluvii]|nr:AAA family ATPase [Ancylobacter defluvii]MBS7590192.1 AAA family ATPase [Ancylobacter defluvii]
MRFHIIARTMTFPSSGNDVAFLKIDHWNDYSFVTMFDVVVFDAAGKRADLGAVKIGFVSQTEDISTYTTLEEQFDVLPQHYFSLGQDVEYYQKIRSNLSAETAEAYLRGLRDMAFDEAYQRIASGQRVFRTSLLRSVSVSSLEKDGQFKRVLDGRAPLTDFDFGFARPQSDTMAAVEMRFKVVAGSKPSTNIHALIGRNGVGKTTILNDMVRAIMAPTETQAAFYRPGLFGNTPIERTYFSSLISVAFSAFDPFKPPAEQPDPEKGTRYYYLGLKDGEDDGGILLKSLTALRDECATSLRECFSDSGRTTRWLTAIRTLESDENFALMNLGQLVTYSGDVLQRESRSIVDKMSSGHAVVLLTISRLVAKVEEKTLVLIDEPESHLHPPLLSAFTRAISELLHNRNGVAIIATHSPVVLQEVPRSCASVVIRQRLSMVVTPPTIETFGENAGVLTREVFGLEVIKSGFHDLLARAVRAGGTYDEIIAEHGGQIGMEARGILRAMVAERDSSRSTLS